MRSYQFVFAIFAALATQGNVASALPQGDFSSRGEYITGRSPHELTKGVDSALKAQHDYELSARDISEELALRDLEVRTFPPPLPEGFKNLQDWVVSLGVIAGACAAGVHFGSLAVLSQEQRDCVYKWLAEKWTHIISKVNKKYKATPEDVRSALHTG